MLILTCVLAFGPYFSYDTPACLEFQIEDRFVVDEVQYGYLYSAYAFPNLILPIFGGVFYDYLGARKSMLLFSAVSTLGQFINTIAGYNLSFNTYLAG